MQVAPINPSLSDVQDLLYHIVQHLDPDRSSVEDRTRVRQTLLSAALTCRNFARPALAALWRSLPSDKPLTHLLFTLKLAGYSPFYDGSFHWHTPPVLQLKNSAVSVSSAVYFVSDRMSSYIPECFTSQDPRTHPQWSRFREYAARVRKICLESSLTSLKLSIWSQVSRLMPDEPILPFLHSVDITIGSMDHPNSTVEDTLDLGIVSILLISPSVRQMKLWFQGTMDPDKTKESEHVASTACARAPNLESFTLIAIPWNRSLSMLRGTPRLRSLTVRGLLGFDDIEPLAHLEELEHLFIILSGAGSNPVSTLHLPSLRRVCLSGLWDSICTLVECVLAPHTHSFALNIPQFDAQQLVHRSRQCLQTAARKFPAMERLSIRCTQFPPQSTTLDLSQVALDTSGPGPVMTIVEPLLSLRGLRDITLCFSAHFRLASDDLRMLSEAWPGVEQLRIEVATVEGACAGFESILHFARRCPRLRTLRLPAMDLAPGAFEGLEYPVSPHLLRDLDVAKVAFLHGADLSDEMAAFVQRVFPNAAEKFVKRQMAVTSEGSKAP